MFKRIMSLFLCFVMLFSMLPVSALAEETGEDEAIIEEEMNEKEGEPEEPDILESEEDPKPEFVAVSSVAVTQAENVTEITAGETLQLTAAVSPENATDASVSWESSDNAVASVDDTGKVTAVAAGSVTIIACAGEEEGSYTLTVKAAEPKEPEESKEPEAPDATEENPIAVTAVEIIQEENLAEVLVTDELQLTAVVSPEDATDKTVTWSSSDDAIATVDGNGLVTGVAEGEVIITATAGDTQACYTLYVAMPKNVPLDVEAGETTSGQCGDDLYWSFDVDTGILTFTASGESGSPMYDYRAGEAPWFALKDQITRIKMEKGMTIGSYAFYNLDQVTQINLPASMLYFQDAFMGMTSLEMITIPSENDGNYQILNQGQAIMRRNANFETGELYNTYTLYAVVPTASGTFDMSNLTMVDTIHFGAFVNCSMLTSIKLPESLGLILPHAFAGCTGLTKITIPANVREVGEEAFALCQNLEEITFLGDAPVFRGNLFVNADSVAIYYNGDDSWAEVDNQNYGATALQWYLSSGQCGDDLYWNFDAETGTLTFTAKGFGSSMFDYGYGQAPWYGLKDKITKIDMQKGITIGKCAFAGLNKVTRVNLPATLLYFENAFIDCSNLETITIPEENDGGFVIINQGSAIMRKNVNETTHEPTGTYTLYAVAPAAAGEFTVPEDVDTIHFGAFLTCSNITSVNLPDSLRQILPDAFGGCTGLTRITLPAEIGWVSEGAFSGCTNLESIQVEAGSELYSSNDGVLFGHTNDNGTEGTVLTIYPAGKKNDAYTVPNHVTDIAIAAFAGCGNLAEITIPDSVKAIGKNAFLGTSNLQTITFEGDLPALEAAVFNGSNPITGYYPADNTSWEDYFADDNERIEFGGNITWVSLIGGQCGEDLYWNFDESSSTLTFTAKGFGSGMYDYGAGQAPWYSLKDKITKIDMQKGITIGNSAFWGLDKVTQLNLPESMLYFQDAFMGMSSLKTISIPEENYGGYVIINDGSAIMRANVDQETNDPTGTYTLYAVAPATAGEFIVPDGVDTIHFGAFLTCNNITSVKLPGRLKLILPHAFAQCNGLTEITIPAGVMAIGNDAFANCKNLKNVTFKGSAPDFEGNLFTGIASVAVRYNGDASWAKIVNKNYGATKATWSIIHDGQCGEDLYWTFSPSNGTLTITAHGEFGSHMDDYGYGQAPWFAFRDKITKIDMQKGITIGQCAFAGLNRVTQVNLPATLLYFENAFIDCSSLKTITIPEGNGGGFVAINNGSAIMRANVSEDTHEPTGTYTLYAVAPATSGVFDVPEGIDTIHFGAFVTCSKITSVNLPDSLRLILPDAFGGCAGLTSITLPAGIEWVERGAFSGCTKLERILVKAGSELCSSVDGVLFGHGKENEEERTYLMVYPCGKKDSTYTVPDYVTDILPAAFAANPYLTSVKLQNNVKVIATNAFMGCSKITEMVIPASVQKIEENAFARVPLQTVIFEGNLPELTGAIFTTDNEITAYYPADNESWAVYFAEDYTGPTFGGSINWIADDTVGGTCGNDAQWELVSRDEGGYAMYIFGTGAVYGYAADKQPWANYRHMIHELHVGEGITAFGQNVLRDMDNLYHAELPKSLIALGEGNFTDCVSLNEIVFPGSNTTFTVEYDYGAPMLINQRTKKLVAAMGGAPFANIPEGIVSIGSGAFTNCLHMQTIVIPASVNSIGANIFNPNGISEIKMVFDGAKPAINAAAFAGRNILLIHGEDASWGSEGILGGTCGVDLFWYMQGNTLVISASAYGSNMHDYEPGEAPWYAYRDQITMIDMQKGITIGANAFHNMDKVTKVKLPASLLYFENAFAGCSSLAEIIIPPNNNGNYQALNEGKAIMRRNANFETGELLDSYTLYAVAPATSGVFNIPEVVDTIHFGAFDGCDITSVVLPESLQLILPGAFANCNRMTEIVIPANVKYIQSHAFDGCKNLQKITLCSNKIQLDDDTFAGIGNVEVHYPQASPWTWDMQQDFGGVNIFWVVDRAENACGDNLTWKLENGTLTISGFGSMDYYDEEPAPWQSKANEITAIVVDEGVQEIGWNAFVDLPNLTTVSLPNTLEYFETNTAFQGCSKLDSFTVAEGGTFTTALNDKILVADDSGMPTVVAAAKTLSGAVILPDGIVAISAYAFAGCTGLDTLTIPGKLEYIGERALGGCDGITLFFENNVPGDLSDSALAGAQNVTIYYDGYHYPEWSCVETDEVNLWGGENITRCCGGISDGLLWTLDNFGTLTIAPWDGNTAIPSYSFSDARSADCAIWHEMASEIHAIVIAEGITDIGDHALSNMNWVYDLTLPTTLTSLGKQELYNNNSLSYIAMSTENASSAGGYFTDNGALYQTVGEETILLTVPAGLGGSFAVKEGTTQIGDYAFANCDWMFNVTLPSTLKRIGAYAFQNCGSLNPLIFHGSMMTIGSHAFDGANLNQLMFGAMPPELDEDALVGFSGTISYYAHEQWNDFIAAIEEEGKYSVQWQPGGECGTGVSWSLWQIGADENGNKRWELDIYAYGQNATMTDYSSADSTPWAEYRDHIVRLYFEVAEISNLTHIGDHAFEGLPIKGTDLPEGVVSIGDYAFANTPMWGIGLPDSITEIGKRAFYNATNLESIHLTNKADTVSIGEAAFEGCKNLNNLTIPADAKIATHYDDSGNLCGAFEGCSQIFNITITPGKTGKMPNYTGDSYPLTPWAQVFKPAITVESGVKNIGAYAFHGKGYDNDCHSIRSISIPDTVTDIGAYAFAETWLLKTIDLPEGLKSIGMSAFMSSRLTAIDIPDTVESIGSTAFHDCIDLKTANIPAGVSYIDSFTFSRTAIQNIRIPESVTTIGQYAFAYCQKLSHVVFEGAVERDIEYNAFMTDFGAAKLTVSYPGTLEEFKENTRREMGNDRLTAYNSSFINTSGVSILYNGKAVDGSAIQVPVNVPITLMPQAEGTNLQWLKDNAAVSANADGSLTVKNTKTGKTTIALKNKDTGITVSVQVEFKNLATAVDIAGHMNGKLSAYSNVTLTSKVTPSTANQNLIWSLENGTGKAELTRAVDWTNEDNVGCTRVWITPIAPGTITICAEALDGSGVVLEKELEIMDYGDAAIVSDATHYVPPVPTDPYPMAYSWMVGTTSSNVNKSITLKVEYPEKMVADGLTQNAQVKWYFADSSNAANAYVTLNASTGKLTAKKNAPEMLSIPVVAEVWAGGVIWTGAYHNVLVYPAAKSVTIEGPDGESSTGIMNYTIDVNNLAASETMRFDAYVNPEGANPRVTWETSDKSGVYAAYDHAGGNSITYFVMPNAQNQKTGNVTLTAKANDGSGKKNQVVLKFVRYAHNVEILNSAGTEVIDGVMCLRGGNSVTFTTDVAKGKFVNEYGELQTLDKALALTDKNVVWDMPNEADLAYASITSAGKLTTRAVSEPVEITVRATVKATGASDYVTIQLCPSADAVKIARVQERIGDFGELVVGLDIFENNQTLTIDPSKDCVNGTVQLAPIFYPQEIGVIEEGTWVSKHPAIATIDEFGVLTPIKNGTATITFTASDGSKKTTALKVKITAPVTAVSIQNADKEFNDLRSGKSMTLKASTYTRILDDEGNALVNVLAANQKVTWAFADSEDPNNAYVKLDTKSGKVTAKTVQRNVQVNVIAISQEGGKVSESITLTVRPSATHTLDIFRAGEKVTGKTLNVDYLDDLDLAAFFYTSVDGMNETETEDAVVTWTTDKPKIVAIEDGLPKIVGTGKAKLTAKISYLVGTKTQTKSVSVTVNVVKLARTVEISEPASTDLRSGSGLTLMAYAYAEEGVYATNKAVNWLSSDPSAATVTSAGKVTAKAVTVDTPVTITATAKDGAPVSDSIELTIRPKLSHTLYVYRDGADVSGKTVTVDYMEALDLQGMLYTSVVGVAGSDVPEMADVIWTSSNTKIIKIEDNAPKMIAAGTAKLTAKYTYTNDVGKPATASAYVNIKVVKLAREVVITQPKSIDVRSGSSLTLKAYGYAEPNVKATNSAVTWISSDPAVATVNSSGKVTAKTVAENTGVTITATAKDGTAVYETIDLMIRPKANYTVNLWNGDNLYTNKTITQDITWEHDINLSAMVYTSVAGHTDDGELLDKTNVATWKSSNTKVAQSLGNGKFYLAGTGSATITVTYNKVSVKFTLKTVKNVDSLTITDTKGKTPVSELVSGKSTTLKANAYAENGDKATNQTVTWTSSNPAVATVNSSGKVTAKTVAVNTWVTFTAASKEDSTIKESWDVMIRPKAARTLYLYDENGVNVAGKTHTVVINGGEAGAPALVLYTSDAKDIYNRDGRFAHAGELSENGESVIWTSSNKKVAEVDPYGTLILNGTGSATITAKYTYRNASGKTANMSVKYTLKVVRLVDQIDITAPAGYLISGKTLTLKAGIIPSNATNKAVTWQSSDPSVATVNTSGTVTAKKVYNVENVTITAIAKDGSGIETSYDLLVLPAATNLSVRYMGETLNNRTIAYALSEGDMILESQVYPYDALQNVKWKSSSTKIAQVCVDPDTGVVSVKPLKTGTVTITASATDGSGKSVSFKLKIVNG